MDKRNIQVIVSDNGQGFVVKQRANDGFKHFGLDMMHERAAMIRGRLEVRSTPGAGTKVIFYVPYLERTPSISIEQESHALHGQRVLLADDSAIFAEGLKNLLVARGLDVVGIARNGAEALEQTRLLQPEVVIMDVMMPGMNGIEAARAIKDEFPETKIVMLTASEKEEHLIEAIKNGASGFLLKDMDANEFCVQLSNLMRGETILPPRIAAQVIATSGHRAETTPLRKALSAHQQEILDMVATGMTYKEVAVALNLSEKTIKYHMAQILERLQLGNRNQAIAFARQNLKE